ncbi:MAG: UbiH/UbiF family hydroxylase [Bauldia sp.]
MPLIQQTPRHGEPLAPDILVVGGGPVGLAAALLLDQAGYRVTLVAPPATVEDERTSALLAGSVRLLEQIGVWPRVAGSAAPLRTLRIVDATNRLIRAPEVVFNAGEIGLETFGYNLPNTALHRGLEAAIVESGVDRITDRVESVAVGPEAITAQLAAGREIAARLIVAADGRLSRVRECLGVTTSEWRYDQAALVVNLRHSEPHHDTSTEFHTASGPFTLVPLPGNRSSLVWVGRPQETKHRASLADTELAAAIEQQSAAILGDIAIDGRRQVFPLAGMNARRFATDRAMFVGEAAHLVPPIGAQGLNLGYRDVAAIGQLLAERDADPGATRHLVAYDRMRRTDVQSRTAAVDALNRTLLSDFLPVQGVRGLGLFLLGRISPLRRAVMRQGVALAG